jgi:hypothetical protein
MGKKEKEREIDFLFQRHLIKPAAMHPPGKGAINRAN